MKKNIYSSLFFAICTVAFNAHSADGNIAIVANFVTPTCNVRSSSANMTVPLGDIQRTELSNQGAMSAKIPFTLELTDCVINSSTYVTFEGTATASDNSAFALDNEGQSDTANGIGLVITNHFDVTQQPNVSGYTGTAINKDFSHTFTARYKAFSNDVKPGNANVTVQYSVTYL